MIHITTKSKKDAYTFTQDELDQLSLHVQAIRNYETANPGVVDDAVVGMLVSMEGWAAKKPHQIKALSQAQVKFMNDVLAQFDLTGFAAVPPTPIVVTPPANDQQFRQLNARMAGIEAKLERLLSLMQGAKPLFGASTIQVAQAPKSGAMLRQLAQRSQPDA